MSDVQKCGMSQELRDALDRIKGHVMTPREKFEQRVSFVYGQQDWSSPVQKSKDEIRQHLIEIYGYPDAALKGNQ